MDNDIEIKNHPKGNGKVLMGMILLVVGCILLLRQLNIFFFPWWIWNWPTWLLIWGIWVGMKHNFKKPIWIFLVVIGGVGMLSYALPMLNLGNFIFPLVIISLGIWIIIRKKYQTNPEKLNWKQENWNAEWDARQQAAADPNAPVTPPPYTNPGSTYSGHAGDDWLDTVSVFSGVKKTILSKNFRGGEIVNVFGGTELDFTQADINGRVILDLTQIFGGTKLVVPANWQVVSDIASVFAGVDDKRMRMNPIGDNNKILVLKGTSIFAGVDIRSY